MLVVVSRVPRLPGWDSKYVKDIHVARPPKANMIVGQLGWPIMCGLQAFCGRLPHANRSAKNLNLSANV